MRITTILAASLLLSAAALTCQEIPAGTVVPVMTTTSIDSAKMKPGQVFVGKVMAQVPLPSGDFIPAGSKVYGHVVQVSQAEGGSDTSLALSFDRIVAKDQDYAIVANVRALAAMMAIFESQVPLFEPDTTPQGARMFAPVGGEAAFRPDNPEQSWNKIVKFSGDIPPGCGSRIDHEGGTGALWVFSPYACGVYGFGHALALAKDGRGNPPGHIELIAKKRVEIHAGSGWLLKVAPASLAAAGAQ